MPSNISKINDIKYLQNVDSVIEMIEDIFYEDREAELTEKQSISVNITLYELELLIKEIKHLREIKK